MNAKKLVHLALPEATHTRLKELAKATGRTIPGYLRWLVNCHFRELDQSGKDEKQFPVLHLHEDEESF